MRGKRRSVSTAELRELVKEKCLAELGELCRKEGSVPADDFRRGLLQMKAERDEARSRSQPVREANRAIRDLADAADRGRRALDVLGDREETRRGPLARLRAVLAILDASDDFDRFAHRDPDLGSPDGRWEERHRRAVIGEFAESNFLGLRRGPKIRELALLRLLFDPEHGLSRRREENVVAIRTPFNVIRAEMDALRKLVKADKLARKHVLVARD